VHNINISLAKKNAFFWDVTPCDFCKNRCFGGIRVTRISELGTTLAITSTEAYCEEIPRLPILVPLMMEEIHSPEMLVLTRATWHNIPDDGILHSHHRENLKSYFSLAV
jgi:hypothetical protein